MSQNRRLVWNRKTETKDHLGRSRVRYSVELQQGGTLAVAIPLNPSANQAFEIADQLREFVDVLAMGAAQPDGESAVREELLAKAKELQGLKELHTTVRGARLEQLLDAYGTFRGAVVEYLLTIEYLCSTARAQVSGGPAPGGA
jgi:hypothetical protein